MEHTTATFKNRHGYRIFYRNWRTNGHPKGILIIIHGLHNHSGCYHDFALQLNASGFEVFAGDLRGYGKSEGRRHDVADYNDHINDIEMLVDLTSLAHPKKPVFLFGHGIGGLLSALYALVVPSKIKGLITESVTLEFNTLPVAPPVIRLLASFLPRLSFQTIKNKNFTRASAVIHAMDHDPLLKNRKLTVRSMQQYFLAATDLKRAAVLLKLPILILHGTADKIAKISGSNFLMEAVSSVDKTLKFYEGHYHDLISDKYNGLVIRDIIKWLNRKTADCMIG